MLKRLLNFLGGHGESATTHTHNPELTKEKSEYEGRKTNKRYYY